MNSRRFRRPLWGGERCMLTWLRFMLYHIPKVDSDQPTEEATEVLWAHVRYYAGNRDYIKGPVVAMEGCTCSTDGLVARVVSRGLFLTPVRQYTCTMRAIVSYHWNQNPTIPSSCMFISGSQFSVVAHQPHGWTYSLACLHLMTLQTYSLQLSTVDALFMEFPEDQ